MLSLTRIFLHNWHRFSDHEIDVDDSLYLAGHNGSGKSSILDAIQMVLVADLQRIRFNSSAQERSQRTLDSYVRGKIGEGRWLRPGNTVAYVALEFSEKGRGDKATLGVCIEAGEGKSTERSYFILPEALDRGLFVVDGRPRPRRELKQALRNRRGSRVFNQIGEYQDEMLNRLGGLNPRFFDLFQRALTFQPIRDIREFVEQWILAESPLDLENLQRVVERLCALRQSAQEVEERLTALDAIVERQSEVRRRRDRHAEYTVLTALLHVAVAGRRCAELGNQVERLRQHIAQSEAALSNAQAARAGAEEALLEAEVQLRQSDVVRRRDELQREIQRATAEADRIRARWADLRRDLSGEAAILRGTVAAPGLEAAGQAAVQALLSTVDGLTPEAPPPEALAPLTEAAIQALDAALVRAQEERFRLRQQIEELRERGKVLEQELAELRTGRATYPSNVERLREVLALTLGERPPLLCELLEVRDERWQNAVEAMLGQRRFNVIVRPEHFDAALRVLDQARADQGLYDVGLLDLQKVLGDARPAQPGSLALQVETAVRALRAYIDSILGDIITCDSVVQLRRHRRSVTPEVVAYSEWTARAVPPNRYRPWFIGARAQRSQIEAREHDLQRIGEQLAALAPQVATIEGRVASLDRGRALSNLRQRLDQPLDERPLREQSGEYEAELRALDLSGVEALEREVEWLRGLVVQEREAEKRLIAQVARLQEQARQVEGELQSVRREQSERERQAAELRTRLPQAVSGAEALLAQRLDQPDLDAAIRNAENTARNFETRAANELQRLTQEATTYNTRYQFAAQAGNPDEERYSAEQQRLAATDLPRYKEQIAQAQREAEEELREHVLHRLREQIQRAKNDLHRMNDALAPLEFHGERYRFRYDPADEVREFYDLIDSAQLLGAGSLFESQFYHDHQATFDRFYETLTRTPQSEAERREQERLIDYRRYLGYDIEVTHADGQKSRLSRIMGQTSGGETQTPFYLTIAASFVQLYRLNERNSRPTMRLIAFDEAFSKMDQDRIGSTLELFQHFKLQVVTATPLERCEYLVPKMCTNLVLTGAGDIVLIEPYRNYAARIETFTDPRPGS